MEFYSTASQKITDRVTMLPQKGSDSGGSNRPLNSYVIDAGTRPILFDAPYSWVMEAVKALDPAPVALVLSHRNTAGSGDAFGEIDAAFGIPVCLHPDDAVHEEARETGIDFADPRGFKTLGAAGIEVLTVPGHTDGSVMLYLRDEATLLAGDCAVGPGPEQADAPARLQRPVMGAEAGAVFVPAWKAVLADRRVDAVLPLHGRAYFRDAEGDEGFDRILRAIWEDEPMDPSGS